MQIPEVLNSIELTDEQTQALDKFFEEYSNNLKAKYSSEVDKEAIEKIAKDKARKALQAFAEDAEKAFELFEKDAEKAFDLFAEDADKAFTLFQEEKVNEYTEITAKAIQDIYEEIEAKVKDDFVYSEEYQAFKKAKEAMIPVIISEDQKEMLDKLKEIKEKEAMLEEAEKDLSRSAAINTLLKDFPEKYYETVKKFISESKDEEEVYSRFNTIVEMIDIDSASFKQPVVEEVVDKEKTERIKRILKKRRDEAAALVEEKQKETKAEKPIFESTSVENNTRPETDKKKKPIFEDKDLELINLAFGKMM